MEPCQITIGGLPVPPPVEGALVRVTAHFSTPAGEPVDPTTIRFRVLEPDYTETQVVDTNEAQTVTITGSPTGGTFTLTLSGSTTAAIEHDAAASAVQTALRAIASVDGPNVAVSGPAGGPYTVDFIGSLATTNVAQMTATSSLTGGSTPSVTVTTTTVSAASADLVQEQDDQGDPVPGRYYSDVEVDSPGTWAFRWEADVSHGGASERTLQVRPSAF